jgi:hypothetical protein
MPTRMRMIPTPADNAFPIGSAQIERDPVREYAIRNSPMIIAAEATRSRFLMSNLSQRAPRNALNFP